MEDCIGISSKDYPRMQPVAHTSAFGKAVPDVHEANVRFQNWLASTDGVQVPNGMGALRKFNFKTMQ